MISIEALVSGAFYWIKAYDEITIGKWDAKSFCFWIVGSDEPFRIIRDIKIEDVLGIVAPISTFEV